MTEVAWREDDFEGSGFDPRMFASTGGTSASIIENERSISFIFYSWNGQWIYGEKLTRLQRHFPPYSIHTGIVLSRASIEELSHQVERNASVSASYANLYEDDESQNVAAHPLTRAVYEQLAGLSESIGQPILLVLNQFVTSLPKTETTKLPALRLAILDDSSYLLEWTFKDRRLGFSFESDPKDSGWYYVYSRGSSELYESGTMDQLELRRLIAKALNP